MRIAALDLGSNSFHLLVVEVRPDGSFEPIVREKEMLRLGDVVAREGSLTEEAAGLAVETVKRFRSIAETAGADEIVAYATAALREASNGPQVVERLESDTGVRVKVINGIREAQLIFEAVRASVLIEHGPALSADLGGGSLELSVGDRSGLVYATSLRLGVGRLTTEVVRTDPPSNKEVARLRRRVSQELEEVMPEIADLAPRQLIGSSGTFGALIRAAAALREGALPPISNQLTVARKDLEALSEQVFTLDVDERAKIPGIDSRRAELLPAGMVVAQELMSLGGFDEITWSEWALREGIVLSVLRKHDKADFGDDPRAIRRASVLSLCRRSSWRERHGREVARLAGQLFDATAALHELGAKDREMLELASLLHDIGEHVSRDGHARHTAYLVENGGLRGFTPDEVMMLSVLGRYHTRGKPRETFAAWEALSDEDKERTLKLLSLLRIADGLDVSHASIVNGIDAVLNEDTVEIVVTARGDAELERWMFQRKKELFEEVYGRAAELWVTTAGHDEFEALATGSAGLG